MRILFVNTLFHPDIGGGAEIILKNQIESLAGQGHHVALLTIGRERGIKTEVVDDITVFRCGYRNLYFHHAASKPAVVFRVLWHILDIYNIGMRRAAAAAISQFAPDVAVCHNIAGWSVSIYDALRAAAVPIVQTLHDQYFLCVKSTMFRRGRRCEQRCAGCVLARLPHKSRVNAASAVVGVSNFILNKLVGYNYFSTVQRRYVIRNVAGHFGPLRDLPLNFSGADLTLGYIGGLTEAKGVEMLLTAFSRSADPTWRLVVAGSGDAQYEARLRARHTDPRIRFVGRVDAASFYPMLDACVVPSVWEDTLPSVVFESLVHGVPVLASRLGGIPEMIEEGQNGLLFEPTDDGVEKAIRAFAQSRCFWAQQSDAIRIKAQQQFSDSSEWALRWEAVLKSAVAGSENVSRP